ncbi:MAG: glycosyltransferase family 4 protein [bacterium]
MRIAINARSLTSNKTGIGNYILNLIFALAEIDKKNDYVILYDPSQIKGNFKLPNQKNFELAPCQWENYWEQICLPTELEKRHIDILHSPAFTIPVIKVCKTVVTIHDITYKLFPENFDRYAIDYYNKWVPISVQNSNMVITDSECTTRDVMEHYSIPKEKIETIHLACGKEFQKLPYVDLSFVRQRYGIKERYILYVGTLEYRKNIHRMLSAFKLLKQRNGIEHQFLLVGKQRPSFNINGIIEELDLEGSVVLTNYIPDYFLPILYNAADMFVYVSLYEGFGIPPLEAMSCGIPVISSNTSSLPEVVGDAALMVDPYDIEDIANAMYQLITDQDKWQELSRKGVERSRHFSWIKTASKTLSVYNKLQNLAV